MNTDEDEKYHWFVIFRKGEKPYSYLYRTIGHMTDVIQRSYERTGSYPHRMWVIVNDEVNKVVINK